MDVIERVSRTAEPDVWMAIEDVGQSPYDKSRWRSAAMNRASVWVTAYRAALEEQGMVVVPRVPTEAMCNAGFPYIHARKCYRAMIAAAPKGDKG